MRALIVYDSVHGNTQKVAQAIGDAPGGEVSVRHVSEVSVADVEAVDLLIVGSPTHGGWFTEAIKDWLDQLPAADLQGIRVVNMPPGAPPGTKMVSVSHTPEPRERVW
jgi:flavodoxin